MAKYLVEGSSLVRIASAVRRKTGTYVKLTLDDMVTAIDGIETGSLPSGVTALDSGTFTPASDVTTPRTQLHNLGVAPNFFFLFAEGESVSHTDFNYYISHEFGLVQGFTGTQSGAVFRIVRYSNGNTFQQLVAAGAAASYNANAFQIYASSTYSLKAGVTYRWVAGVLEGI